MPAASDLVLYNSANMPDTDSGTAGGAIDALRRPDFTQLAANDDIEALSSNAGDTTQTLTIEGRDSQGRVVSETKTLNGTTAVIFSTISVIERVLKAELSATTTGSITVRRSVAGATLRVIPAGERGFWMCFRKTASDPSVQKNFYAKLFWKNTHGSQAALSATVIQNADPDGIITHVLAAAVDDSVTTTNRVTAPSGTFDDTNKTIPGTDLASGSAIGVWLRQQLPAADAPHRTTYTSEIDFSSV
jgi:hypothetical protein